MKKLELKEIIKSAILEEAQDSKKGNKEEQERMEGAIRDDRDHIKDLEDDIKDNEKKLAKLKKDFKDDVNEGNAKYYEDSMKKDEPTEVFTDAELDMASEMLMDMFDKLGLENNVEKSDALVKYINAWFETNDFVNEAEEEEAEEEVEITDTEEEVEVIDTEKEAPSLISRNDEKILNSLEAALSSAQELGDEKLTNQIGNTITFFTRQHIVKEEDLFEIKRMKRLAGILK